MNIQVYHSKYKLGVEEIFRQTTKAKEEDNPNLFLKLKKQFLDYYLENYPKSCFVYIEKELVLGYILISKETLKDTFLLNTLDYMKEFKKNYQDYPAHLHINCLKLAQGKGVGSKLIKYTSEYLQQEKVKGLHLITNKNARNVSFYLKNQFKIINEIEYKDSSLLLLGKKLNFI